MADASETRLEPPPPEIRRTDPHDPGAGGPMTPQKILWRLALLALLLAGFVWIYFLEGPAIEESAESAAPPAVTSPAEP